jgi:hypothetical protein
MKSKIICCCLFILLSFCETPINEVYNLDAYRDGSDSGVLTNNSSLIGEWEETYEWISGDGEMKPYWDPIYINHRTNYVFLENGTFTQNNRYSGSNCLKASGTYLVEGRKITLKYVCETQPEIIKEVVIDEFFFRENYIVFKQGDNYYQGDNYNNISKFELVN